MEGSRNRSLRGIFTLVTGATFALVARGAWAQTQSNTEPAATSMQTDSAPTVQGGAVTPPGAGATPPVDTRAASAPPPPPVVPPALRHSGPAARHSSDHGEPMTITGSPGHGVTLRSADDGFAMTIRGRFMLRDTVTVTPPSMPGGTTGLLNEFSVRRARLVVSGHAFSRDVRYYMQLAFANQDNEIDRPIPLLDAYLDLTRLRDLNVRIGQQIVPFDRARVISSSSAQLVDRSPVVGALNLDRDIGVQLYSTDLFGLGHLLGYQLGVFMGEGRNRLGSSLSGPGLLYTARVQILPFGQFDDYVEGDLTRAPRPRLAIGIGGAFNHNATRTNGNTGSNFAQSFNTLHGEVDAIFKFAGFSLLAQVMYRGADVPFHDVPVPNMPGTTTREYSRSAWGYFVQAGMMLSDHFELAARWSDLYPILPEDPAQRDASQHISRELGGGLSWYIHQHVFKIQADYFYQFRDRLDDHPVHQARAQMQLQF